MSTAIRRFIRAVLITGACSAIAASALLAQGVRGIVVSGEAAVPVPAAQIRLMVGDRFVAQAFADSAGRFVIAAPKNGDYNLVVSRIGYERVEMELGLARGRMAEVKIHLGVRPVQLPAITVLGEGMDIRERANYEGMLARRAIQGPTLLGRQVVLKRGDPEFDNSASIADALGWLSLRKCVYYYWNAIPYNMGAMIGESIAHISAIEVYRSQLDAPREFRSNAMFVHPAIAMNTSTTRECSMVVIWSNR